MSDRSSGGTKSKYAPLAAKLSVTRNWASRWYAGNSNFSAMPAEDLKARAYLKTKLKNASIGRIIIERPAKNARFTIYSSRPGVVIGKKGEDIEVLKSALTRIMGVPVHVNIEEIRKPEIDSQLIADSIAQQLEKRIMFRRAMKRAMQNAMRLGALGIKIMSSGRLNGIEIARKEWYREGRVPLHTLRADIDYGTSEASTTYGIIGVKVWVYKGDRAPNGDPPIIDTPQRKKKAKVPDSHYSPLQRIVDLSRSDTENLLLSLPDWVGRQRVTEARKLLLKMDGASTTSGLFEFLLQSAPSPIAVRPMAGIAEFEPEKKYAALGRFPSGAVRTIGKLDVGSTGEGMIVPFGFWSLIDPDDESLDMSITTSIDSSIEFLVFEVV